MSSTYLMLMGFLLGWVCGLRSMTAPALVCWAAHLGWLNLAGSRLNFLASPISVAVFTLFAIAELVADKLPSVPARVSPGPLIVRGVFAALCGWALGTSASLSPEVIAATGTVGAVAGATAGFHLRRFLTMEKGLPDLPIAFAEDACAIAIGLFVVTRF